MPMIILKLILLLLVKTALNIADQFKYSQSIVLLGPDLFINCMAISTATNLLAPFT